MSAINVILLWGCTLFVTGVICYQKGYVKGKNNKEKKEEGND